MRENDEGSRITTLISAKIFFTFIGVKNKILGEFFFYIHQCGFYIHGVAFMGGRFCRLDNVQQKM
jgi:hypothetical protein